MLTGMDGFRMQNRIFKLKREERRRREWKKPNIRCGLREKKVFLMSSGIKNICATVKLSLHWPGTHSLASLFMWKWPNDKNNIMLFTALLFLNLHIAIPEKKLNWKIPASRSLKHCCKAIKALKNCICLCLLVLDKFHACTGRFLPSGVFVFQTVNCFFSHHSPSHTRFSIETSRDANYKMNDFTEGFNSQQQCWNIFEIAAFLCLL